LTRTEAFKVLGISKVKDAKRAYRKLAKQHHPDCGGDPADFKMIGDAYRIAMETTSRYSSGGAMMSGMFSEKGQTMNESKFTKKLVDALERHGAKTFKVHGHPMQKRGVSDLYIAHTWWTGWLELKVTGSVPSDLQYKWLKDLTKLNVAAYWVRLDEKEDTICIYSWDDVLLDGCKASDWFARPLLDQGAEMLKALQGC